MAKDYYIWLNGEKIPVTEEVYYAYKRPAWREFKRAKVRSDNERSLDAFLDCGFDIPSEQALVDEIVADKLLLDELFVALAELTDDERSLIDALYYQEQSESDFAKTSKISQQAVSKRKKKILDKLRQKLKFEK